MSSIIPSPNLLTGKVGINTTAPSEALEIGSTTAQNNRLKLTSYFETDSSGTAELIRLFFANALNMNGNSSKAAIAWYDANSPTQAKVWVQAHNYLHYFNTYTFLPAAVNTGTNQINIPAYGYPVDGWQVQFSTTGTLPAPLATSTNYYVKKVDNNNFQVYTDSGLSSLVTLTTQGTGTHTITPNLAYNNNDHQHFSIEVTGTDGLTKSSRFSIPYDKDTVEIGFFGSNVNVNGNLLRVVGAAGSNRQIVLGNTLSDNLSPDGTEKRWIVEADSTAEGGSNAGSNFEVLAYSDTGASPATRLFIRRASAQIGLSGNTNPGADLDIGVASAGGATVSSRLNRGTTSQFASMIFDTAGTDEWSVQLRNDSTNDLHIRDNVNTRNHINFLQSSGITQLASGVAKTLVTKSGNYTATNQDHNILVDSTSGAITITLPTAATLAGEEFLIKDWKGQAQSHNITVATTSSQTIDGASTVVISTNYGKVRVVSDGANWSLLEATPPPPAIISSSEAFAISGTTANVLVANVVYLYEFELTVATTFSGAKWRVAGTATGSSDIGIYTFDGNTLKANLGGVTNTASTTMSANFSGGNVTLQPGQYFATFTCSNSTDTIVGIAIGQAIIASRCRQATNSSSGSPVVLPSTTGGYSDTPTKFPAFALTVVGGLT